MTKLLIHHINQIKLHKMTKDRILLLDSYISFYTLGALTDDSDDVLVLNQTLYDGTFPLKDLVSKSFDVKSFEKSVSFNIYNTRKLSKLRKPAMPYKLQVGSSVRYKNKSYQVIGYYYNQFAQLNIISPILFNPSNVVTDVANLFYGLKSNKEVIDIINDNFVAGKYSNDIVFPLTVGVKNYKKELTNIQAPPFTSLDSLTIKKKEEIKVGEPLIPYEFDANQLNRKNIVQKLEGKADAEIIEKSDVDFYADINSFSDLSSKRIPNTDDFKDFSDGELFETNGNSHLMLGDGELPLLPYNLISKKKVESLKEEYVYQTPIGDLYPILKVAIQRTHHDKDSYLSDNYFFGIYNSKNLRTRCPRIVQDVIFTDNGKEQYEKYAKTLSKDFLRINEYNFTTSLGVNYLENYNYVFKENISYGGFYVTSGTRKLNSLTDSMVLPFGTIFKKSGIYYYVLSYLDTTEESNAYCLCIKASTRKSITELDFYVRTLTEVRASYKKFSKEEVYTAFQKEGHIFDIDDSFYSLPQSIQIDRGEETKKEASNPTLVTDVFLDKRSEQFEVLQSNFPELSNTFLGILSVLDKSISKPKIKEMVQEKGLVYLKLADNTAVDNVNSSAYRDEENDKLAKLLEEVALRNSNKYLFTGDGGKNISDTIKNLALDTRTVLVENYRSFYVGLKSYEDYQKYAICRIAINLYDNYQLFVLNDEKIFRNDKISFPIFNMYSSLSLDCFLGILPPMYVSGIKRDYDSKGDNGNFFFKRHTRYNSDYYLRVFKTNEDVNSKIFLYAQFIFVYNVLKVLFKNARRVIFSKADGKFDSFIENANFVREIRQYDLSLPFNLIRKEKFLDKFFLRTGGRLIDRDLEGELKTLNEVFSYDFRYDNDGKEKFTNFKTLIKNLDKVYGGIFELEEKIFKNEGQSLFANFPKVETKEEEIEEDMFDDTDLFEDAFEELGDEFLENIEELDIDELI